MRKLQRPSHNKTIAAEKKNLYTINTILSPESENMESENMKRIVLLNGIPPAALCGEKVLCKVTLTRMTPEDLASVVRHWRKKAQVVSYIRHPATVEVLRRLLGVDIDVSTGLYKYNSLLFSFELCNMIVLRIKDKNKNVSCYFLLNYAYAERNAEPEKL